MSASRETCVGNRSFHGAFRGASVGLPWDPLSDFHGTSGYSWRGLLEIGNRSRKICCLIVVETSRRLIRILWLKSQFK